ncbi:MAG: hypothetical protein ACLQLH_14585 [Terracidiphilus sp.]
MNRVVFRLLHSIAVETLTIGLHDSSVSMRPYLQGRIDAADEARYDAILLGYALCVRPATWLSKA